MQVETRCRCRDRVAEGQHRPRARELVLQGSKLPGPEVVADIRRQLPGAPEEGEGSRRDGESAARSHGVVAKSVLGLILIVGGTREHGNRNRRFHGGDAS